MSEQYNIRAIQEATGLDKQTVHGYLKEFGLRHIGDAKPRTTAKRRRVDRGTLEKIKLIAALKRDIRFEPSEIQSILKKLTVAQFRELLCTLPFPTLLEELRRRNVKIDTTNHLAHLLDDSSEAVAQENQPAQVDASH